MSNTLAYVKGKNVVPNRAYGHTRGGDKFTETDQSPTSATLGDGGIYSNLTDLAKWDQALENHTLLSEQEMKPALMPIKLANGSQPHWPAGERSDDNLNPGEPVWYGFGWFLNPFEDHTRMWHYGSTMGFRTAIERFTESKLTIVILCNRTDLNPAELALRTANVFFSPAGE